MLSKEERKERNEAFWNRFRKEMRPIRSSNGKSMNWINYPSDVKDIYIRLEADNKGARICFDIQPKDDGIRAILWEQMTELKVVLENEVGKATAWEEFHHYTGNRAVSRIYWEDSTVNFYRNEDQEKITDFLKEKLIAFDAFYQEYKEILISLAG